MYIPGIPLFSSVSSQRLLGLGGPLLIAFDLLDACDLLANVVLHRLVQGRAVTEAEEDLQVDEERRKHESCGTNSICSIMRMGEVG